MKRTRDAVAALLAFIFWVGVFVLSSFAEDMRPLTTMKLGHYAVIWIANGSIMLGALLVFFIDQFIQGLIRWRKVGMRVLARARSIMMIRPSVLKGYMHAKSMEEE